MNQEIINSLNILIKENKIVNTLDDDKCINLGEPLVNYGFNSILFIKLVVAIEKYFNIEFNGNDLLEENFTTLGHFISYIEQRYKLQ